jgi:hypothetical protein
VIGYCINTYDSNTANRLQNSGHAGAIHQLSLIFLIFLYADEVESSLSMLRLDLRSEPTRGLVHSHALVL